MAEETTGSATEGKYPSMAADKVWKISDVMKRNDSQQIYAAPWINDLMTEIRSGGDIEAFIRAKDEKYRQTYMTEALPIIIKEWSKLKKT